MEGGRGASDRTRQYSERVFPALRVCGVLRRRVRRGGGPARRGRPRHTARTQPAAVRRRRCARVAQAGRPAGGTLVQAARRVQPARPARRRRSARPARCARAPATTGRAWPTPAGLLGMRGRVHVPRTTPRQKRERIVALGGDDVELIVDGDTYDEAAAAAADHAARTGRDDGAGVRRPAHDRRAGHRRPRDPGPARPGTGRGRGAGRRRRAARRGRDGAARAASGASAWSGSSRPGRRA